MRNGEPKKTPGVVVITLRQCFITTHPTAYNDCTLIILRVRFSVNGKHAPEQRSLCRVANLDALPERNVEQRRVRVDKLEEEDLHNQRVFVDRRRSVIFYGTKCDTKACSPKQSW